MNRCVLVVEDEPIIRMDTVSMLEEAGLTVVEFDSADEALGFTQRRGHEIAAIFTDINLRGKLSGIDLASIVTGTNPGIKVVVTSGGFDVRPRRLPEAVQFLKKPWQPEELILRLRLNLHWQPSTHPLAEAYRIGSIPGMDVHWGLAVGIIACIISCVLD